MATYSRNKRLLKKHQSNWNNQRKCNEPASRLKLEWIPARYNTGWRKKVFGIYSPSWIFTEVVETSPTKASQNPHQWP